MLFLLSPFLFWNGGCYLIYTQYFLLQVHSLFLGCWLTWKADLKKVSTDGAPSLSEREASCEPGGRASQSNVDLVTTWSSRTFRLFLSSYTPNRESLSVIIRMPFLLLTTTQAADMLGLWVPADMLGSFPAHRFLSCTVVTVFPTTSLTSHSPFSFLPPFTSCNHWHPL